MITACKKWLAILLIWLVAMPGSIFATCHGDAEPVQADMPAMHQHALQEPGSHEAATDPGMHNCDDTHADCGCVQITGLTNLVPATRRAGLFHAYRAPTLALPDYSPELIKPPPRSAC